jgi:hypothetical protein
MKSFKLLPLLLMGMVFIKVDSSACEDHSSKKVAQKKMASVLARSAYKALRSTTNPKVDLHPDFMIGNSMLRF